MRILFVLWIAAWWALPAMAQQEASLNLERVIPGKYTSLTVDNLGFLYVQNDRGLLKKLSPTGDSVAVFNDIRRFGQLQAIDVTNPLKVLLFYRDFGTVVILDRFLTQRSTLDLRRSGLYQVKVVALAYDNNIWVFDEQESKLKRIAEDGQIIDATTDFRMIFDSMPSPKFLVDRDKYVYLYDPEMGVYIFDYYGALKNRIRFLGWTDFMVVNGQLFGRDKDFFYKYETGTLRLESYKIPANLKQAGKILVAPSRLYVLTEEALQIYTY